MLKFVGVRFDWMGGGLYFYGGESEKPHRLDPGESITFSIGFKVSEDVAAGPHTVYLVSVYEIDGLEHREVLQVESPLNVIEIVTVTFTETFTTIIYTRPVVEAPYQRRPLWALIVVAASGASALILFLAYRRGISKRE
ncbi:MAG: hypothetical protein QXE79_02735 [Candidatus Bathyarchaeia archaeon]